MFEFLRHLAHLLWRALISCPSLISQNWLAVGFALSGAFLAFVFEMRDEFSDIKPLRKRISAMLNKRTIWIALKSAIWSSVLLFIFSVVNTVYEDHINIAGENKKLTTLNGDLSRQNSSLNDRANSACKKERGEAIAARKDAQQAKQESNNWQHAWEKYSRGEQFPDRHLYREDRLKLRYLLELIAKEPKNKEYIKIDFGIAPNDEAQHVGFQLYQLFRDAHWNISNPMEFPKDLQEEMQSEGGANASGIYIFTDNPARGRNLGVTLGRICGQGVIVNPRGTPQHYRGLILWVGNKQFTQWKDND